MAESDELLEALLQDISTGEQEKQNLDDVIRAHGAISREQVRWKVTRLVIGAYVVVIVASVIYLIIRSIIHDTDEFANILDLLKIGVIPVVTFVLGYYYGTSSK